MCLSGKAGLVVIRPQKKDWKGPIQYSGRWKQLAGEVAVGNLGGNPRTLATADLAEVEEVEV